MLFSRDLAVTLAGRVETLIRLGLANPKMRSPFLAGDVPALPVTPPPGAVAALCARPDGPAAVVLTGRQPEAAPPGSPTLYVDLPTPNHVLWDSRDFRWVKIETYTVIRCLSASPASPPTR
jgi:hypothetical protein